MFLLHLQQQHFQFEGFYWLYFSCLCFSLILVEMCYTFFFFFVFASSNWFRLLFLPPGQDAITRLCLQRTPDQTVTVSGSQRAPRAFDSTDRVGLCPWEKRDPTPPHTGSSTSLKLSSIGVFFFRPSKTALRHNRAKNLRGRSAKTGTRSLLSPPRVCWHCDHGRLLLSLWWSL